MKNLFTQQLRNEFQTDSDAYVSIYSVIRKPTKGVEWQKLHLKKLYEQAAHKFQQRFSDHSWEPFKNYFQQIIDDDLFWDKHNGRSVALIASENKLSIIDLYSLDVDRVYVSQLPAVLPLIADDQLYPEIDVLALQNESFSYYRLRHGQIERVHFSDDAPTDSIKALGREVDEKNVTFSSIPAGNGRGHSLSFHGHGSSADDKKIDQSNYFRIVAKYLQQHTDIDQKIPVVLFADSQQQAVYREVSKSKRLSRFLTIDKSPAKLTAAEIKKDLETLKDRWNQIRLEHFKEEYDRASDRQLLLNRVELIAQAAAQGQVRELFLLPISDFSDYFTTNDQGQLVLLDRPQDDILEKVSDSVWQQGGEVSFADLNRVNEQSPAVAILRYQE